MRKPEVEEFAKLLIHEVRDRTIQQCDWNFDKSNDDEAKRWRQHMKSDSPEEFARMIIPDCVDAVIGNLLYAIDDGILRLSFTTSEGKNIDLTKEGESEMTGWYAGTAGWIEEYSDQRRNDDFADLA